MSIKDILDRLLGVPGVELSEIDACVDCEHDLSACQECPHAWPRRDADEKDN